MTLDIFAAFKPGATDGQPGGGAFEIPTQSFKVDANKARQRAIRKKMIQPRNAEPLLAELLQMENEGDRLHAVMGGNFVFGDLLAMLAQKKPVRLMTISTLSMSAKNCESLVECLKREEIQILHLLVSHYFVNSNPREREILQAARKAMGEERCFLGVARTHTKICLAEFLDDEKKLVIEASANLRSSDNIEQMSCFLDSDLYEFHRTWITKLMIEKKERSRIEG